MTGGCTAHARPLVLDFDASVGVLPGEQRLALHDWQERLRFGCSLARLRAWTQLLEARLPSTQAGAAAHGTVFLGSGDYHHLSWPLLQRCLRRRPSRDAAPLRVLVLDNHPDNMRFPFGVHCGSWVRRVALLPEVSQVLVVGITSADIGLAHSWENYLQPLRSGKLQYWSLGVDTAWARWLGLGAAFRSFDSMQTLVDTLAEQLQCDPAPSYLSIDKDVFAPDVVRTNWDQGQLQEAQALQLIAALRAAGPLVGSDITGEVSCYRYRSAWKRWLSAQDGQDEGALPPSLLAQWQAKQHALNFRLLAAMGGY